MINYGNNNTHLKSDAGVYAIQCLNNNNNNDNNNKRMQQIGTEGAQG